MAYTGTVLKRDVFGSTRITILTITADAASGAFDSGLSRVIGCAMSPVSVGTAGFKVQINQNSAATALNGSIRISSAASGDGFTLVCYGV